MRLNVSQNLYSVNLTLCIEENEMDVYTVYKVIPNDVADIIIEHARKEQWEIVKHMLSKYPCHKELRMMRK